MLDLALFFLRYSSLDEVCMLIVFIINDTSKPMPFKITLKSGLFILLVLSALLFFFSLQPYLSFEFVQSERQKIFELYSEQPFWFGLAFCCFYILYASFSLPGAIVLTLTAGFIFDFFIGVFVSCLSSNIGALFSFLSVRFFLKDYIQKKFIKSLKKINKSFKQTGFFHLLSLRLIPAVPFFVVNAFMGVSVISVRSYIAGTFLGMLPGTLVIVNAGKHLGDINSTQDIVSLPLLLSFLLLGGFPWILRFLFKKTIKK